MKLKYFEVSPEWMASLSMTGAKIHHEVIEGLPKDAKIIRVQFSDGVNFVLNTIKFIVESEEFKDLKEGELIPKMDIDCKQLELKEEDNDATN